MFGVEDPITHGDQQLSSWRSAAQNQPKDGYLVLFEMSECA